MDIQQFYKRPYVIQAALNAGKAILDVYHSADFGVEMKSDNSPLTVADKKSHVAIVDKLDELGEFPILSEEGGDIDYETRRQWERFWLIDPLDGTKEFIKRNGEFTVNIALIENGVPIEGVIFVPVTRTLYFGSDPDGAFKVENCPERVEDIIAGEVLPLPQDKGDRPFTVVGSRSHMSEETMAFMAEMEKEHVEVEVLSRGSSLKLCMVAEGKADAYPRYAPTMEWDTGAGDAICRAAGCLVTQYGTNEPLQYNKENLLNPWFLVQ